MAYFRDHQSVSLPSWQSRTKAQAITLEATNKSLGGYGEVNPILGNLEAHKRVSALCMYFFTKFLQVF